MQSKIVSINLIILLIFQMDILLYIHIVITYKQYLDFIFNVYIVNIKHITQ